MTDRFYSVYLEYPRATAPAQPLHSGRFSSKAKAAAYAREALRGGHYGFATVNAFLPAGFLGTVTTVFPRRNAGRA